MNHLFDNFVAPTFNHLNARFAGKSARAWFENPKQAGLLINKAIFKLKAGQRNKISLSYECEVGRFLEVAFKHIDNECLTYRVRVELTLFHRDAGIISINDVWGDRFHGKKQTLHKIVTDLRHYLNIFSNNTLGNDKFHRANQYELHEIVISLAEGVLKQENPAPIQAVNSRPPLRKLANPAPSLANTVPGISTTSTVAPQPSNPGPSRCQPASPTQKKNLQQETAGNTCPQSGFHASHPNLESWTFPVSACQPHPKKKCNEKPQATLALNLASTRPIPIPFHPGNNMQENPDGSGSRIHHSDPAPAPCNKKPNQAGSHSPSSQSLTHTETLASTPVRHKEQNKSLLMPKPVGNQQAIVSCEIPPIAEVAQPLKPTTSDLPADISDIALQDIFDDSFTFTDDFFTKKELAAMTTVDFTEILSMGQPPPELNPSRSTDNSNSNKAQHVTPKAVAAAAIVPRRLTNPSENKENIAPSTPQVGKTIIFFFFYKSIWKKKNIEWKK